MVISSYIQDMNQELLNNDLSKVQLKLENTSEWTVDNIMFDPHSVVDSWLQSYPLFNTHYRFNGLWKKDPADTNMLIILFHRKKKN